MALEWTPDLSIGDEEIDSQHQELFRRAARLLDGLHIGQPEEIGGLVDFLREYAVVHFGAEEALMQRVGFPDYVHHKAEHAGFLSDLLALASEYRREGSGAFMSVKASRWLSDWLRNHVSATDAELGKFLRRLAE